MLDMFIEEGKRDGFTCIGVEVAHARMGLASSEMSFLATTEAVCILLLGFTNGQTLLYTIYVHNILGSTPLQITTHSVTRI